MWPVAGHEDDACPYHDFRFPAEIMAHAVRLYHGFGLSLREIERILAQRGIVVSCESIYSWDPAGRASVRTLKRRRPRLGATWPLDKVSVRLRGGIA